MEINDFNPGDFWTPRKLAGMIDTLSLPWPQLIMLGDSGLSRDELVPDRTESSWVRASGMETIEANDDIDRAWASPCFTLHDSIADREYCGGIIAIDLGATGPNFSTVVTGFSFPSRLALFEMITSSRRRYLCREAKLRLPELVLRAFLR